MRSSNKAILAGCMVAAACGGGLYARTPEGDRPQTYQQESPQPLPADGPPPATGPSGTSDRGPERYDEVGYATWYGDELGGARTASGAKFDPDAFTAAHRSLPLGAYAEVTALDSGRTILVRITDRGPSDRALLIDLSRAAAQAIGVKGRSAVRVRQVTPTPEDDSAIRAGRPGAPRLDTPPALLAGLRLRLNGSAPAPAPRLPKPVIADPPQPVIAKPDHQAPAVGRGTPATGASYYVQVGAFSSQARAASLAKSMDGSVVPLGKLWRVRLGPFDSAGRAAQARDGAAKRGYGDAKVVREK
jgi:rare lipoprotein A